MIQREILWSALLRRKGSVTLFLAATFLASACTIGGPLVFAFIIERIRQEGVQVVSVILLFCAYAVLLASVRLLADVRMVLMHSIEQDVRVVANKTTLGALLRCAGSIFVVNNPVRIGELINNLHQSNAIYVQSFLMVVVAGIIDLAFAFAAIGSLVSWSVALFVVVYGASTVMLTLYANKITKQSQRQARRKSAEGANLLGNVVNNIVSIKIFGGQNWIQSLYEDISLSARAFWMKYFKTRLAFGAIQAALIFLQYASIFAMLVVTLDSPALLSQVVLVGMILVQLNRPFEMIASAIEEYTVARVLAEMFQDELDQHERQDTTKPSHLFKPSIVPDIDIRDLSFAYAPRAPAVLNNISASFKTGGINFIVGPSGVGKSTLLSILLGINEGYSGSVRVGNVELNDIERGSYLASLGYVPQEPMLMNMSLRDNVLFGRNHHDNDVIEVLEEVQLGSKLASLEKGLDFLIGERGQLLSGGERQRLAIARAMLGRPKLLILDEASSALDQHTEASIFSNLRKIAKNTIVIAVTHRTNIIQVPDNILDLSSGENDVRATLAGASV